MIEKSPKRRSQSPVNHARHDPATALASLFRPITKGRRPGGLQIESSFDGMEIKFMIWRALDTRDQSVLLAAIGMAGMKNQDLHAEVSGERGQQLWLDLKPSEDACFDRAIVVTTTRYALIHAAGLDDKGQNYGLLEECLERLSMVGSKIRKEDFQWSMNLLSWAEAPDGRLNIALNGRFATALGGQHVRVSLDERRKLHSEPAQLAHAWLSAWLKPGKTQSISLDKLSEKIWGAPSKNESTTRSRRDRTNKSVNEISELKGWQIKVEGRGKKSKATISRSRILNQT
jgi:hypothetical protein